MKWLYGLLCLLFLILFHEFGHFIACILFKVKVTSFSVGFGPVLIHKNIKGTDFRLSLIPLGGYCGMKGDEEFQEAVENNLPQVNASPDSLYGVHSFKKALIGFAGPFFNFIFSVIALSIVNFAGYEYYTYSNKIIIADEIYENFHSPARDAGLLTGDIITKINEKDIKNFSDIVETVSVKPDQILTVQILRDNIPLTLQVLTEMDKNTGTGKLGIAADQNSILKEHTPHYNIFEAIYHGFLDSVDTVKITVESIIVLFKGVDIKNAIGGPARITDILGTSIQNGFNQNSKTGAITILNLMSVISISLFIMNLLPVPILDGALILFALIETITRKKIRPKIQYYSQFVGLFFIAIVFIIGLSSDISYFANRGLK